MKKRLTFIKGAIFTVYFDEAFKPHKDGEATTCRVIAKNAEEAMAKVKQVYPNKTINSMFAVDRSFSGPVPPEGIIF